MKPVVIAPSILSADLCRLGEDGGHCTNSQGGVA
jgi:pentose-5-phosphate-3-epimerase